MSRLQAAIGQGGGRNKAVTAARRSRMRIACVVWAGLGLVVGCTDGGPTPESIEFAEAAPRYEVHAGFEHQPERERVIDPATQPRLELVLVPPRAEHSCDDVCPFAVEFHSFPAISEDGATLVQTHRLANDSAGPLGERMQVTWLDADATLVEEVYDRADDHPWAPDWPGCDPSIERARERVTAINETLEQRVWRPLEPLDAFFSEPGFVEIHTNFTGDEDAALASLAGDDRPIEVFWRNDEFIARIRGMKVLQKTARPGWRLPLDEMCDPTPHIAGVRFDRASGVALVTYNHSSGGCMCDDNAKVGRVELSAEFMAAIDRRSTAPMRLALRALQAEDALEDDAQ